MEGGRRGLRTHYPEVEVPEGKVGTHVKGAILSGRTGKKLLAPNTKRKQ